MRCEDIKELMSEHIDGALDEAGEKRLAEHLAKCEDCRLDLQALKEAVSLVQGLDTVEPPADLLDKIHARIERDREQKPGLLWSFLSLTQVRVAIAACFAAVLCMYGVRELSKDEPACGVRKSMGEPAAARDAAPSALAGDAPVEPDAFMHERAKEPVRRPEAAVSDAEMDRLVVTEEKTEEKKAGRVGGEAGPEAPMPRSDARRETAAKRYRRTKEAADKRSDAFKKGSGAGAGPVVEKKALSGKKMAPMKSAEADGGIWRGSTVAKAKRRPAESAPAAAPEPVLRVAPRPAPPGVAVPAEAMAEEVQEIARKDQKLDFVGVDDAVAAETVQRKTPVAKRLGAREADRSQPMQMTVVTARRADVLEAIDKAAARPVGAVRKIEPAAAAKELERRSAKTRKYEKAVEQAPGRTVMDIRVSAASYVKLLEELKKLGKVTVGALPGVASEAEGAPRVNRAVGDDAGAATTHMTIRVTIVAE